jgi:hypothetical protein
MRYTLQRLIDEFRTDPASPFATLNHAVRARQTRLYDRLIREHGVLSLERIRPRDLIAWHREWLGPGKVAIAHSLVTRLRVLFCYGDVMLENRECRRLSDALSNIRFEKPVLRGEPISEVQINAFRNAARQMGWDSFAMAQALQSDFRLNQKNVIGIYVPPSVQIETDVTHPEYGSWHDGLRWEDIDDNLNVHLRRRRQRTTLIGNLRNASMVMQELAIYCEKPSEKITRDDLPRTGPIILNEQTAFPHTTAEFRRKWRIVADFAQLPKTIMNKDSKRLHPM